MTAKEKSKRIVCLSNSRQLFMAILLYAKEHDNTLPHGGGDPLNATHMGEASTPAYEAMAALGSEEIFICPSMPYGRAPFYHDVAKRWRMVGGISYFGNTPNSHWSAPVYETAKRLTDDPSKTLIGCTVSRFDWIPKVRFAHGARGGADVFGTNDPLSAGCQGTNLVVLDGSGRFEQELVPYRLQGSLAHHSFLYLEDE